MTSETSQPRPHRSIGIMVGASLISAVCGVIFTFCIPRVLSIDDYGIWRTFLLYAGYAGLLHLGLIDGALLLWSKGDGQGQPSQPPPSYITHAIRFLVVEHVLLLSLACGSLLLPSPPFPPALLVALAIYALFLNLVVLLQVYLQTGFHFAAVAFGMTAPNVLFVLSLGVLYLIHVTVEWLMVTYLLAWGIAMVSLLLFSYRRRAATQDERTLPDALPQSTWRIGLTYIAAGWPIVLANTGLGLMQSADRVTVNLVRPLHDFAIYSLSQSTIYVPITILAAVSRVAFSWFARAEHSGRAALYRSSTRLLSLLWMFLLPYYFVVEFVVQRFLPKYIQGLPSGRILLFSVLFLSLIQILQFNTYSLEGRQRQFFLGSLIAVAVAFATAWIGSQKIGTLAAVAWSQVLTAALWWLGNEWFLRKRNLIQWRDILSVLTTFLISTAGLYVASLGDVALVWRPAMYYGVCALPAYFLYRAELRTAWSSAFNFRSKYATKP